MNRRGTEGRREREGGREGGRRNGYVAVDDS